MALGTRAGCLAASKTTMIMCQAPSYCTIFSAMIESGVPPAETQCRAGHVDAGRGACGGALSTLLRAGGEDGDSSSGVSPKKFNIFVFRLWAGTSGQYPEP